MVACTSSGIPFRVLPVAMKSSASADAAVWSLEHLRCSRGRRSAFQCAPMDDPAGRWNTCGVPGVAVAPSNARPWTTLGRRHARSTWNEEGTNSHRDTSERWREALCACTQYRSGRVRSRAPCRCRLQSSSPCYAAALVWIISRGIMVLTKPELIGSLQHEVRILLHLASKIEPAVIDYRPTPKQRSTIELLRYLSIMGPQLVRAAKS